MALPIFYDGINNVIKKYSPDTAVVENIFFAHDIKTALKLGHSRGIVLLSLANAGVFIYEYAPLEVKQAIVGYGMASKDQVQKMVLKLLKLNPNDLRFNKYDISDALALAICHIQTNLELKTDDRQQTIVQSSRFNVQS